MIDLPGKAILNFHTQKSRAKLFVRDAFGPKVEMPISLYFRTYAKMPTIEKLALQHCTGRILDIGAGAGSHALELQKKLEVNALEISPSACETMHSRGVQHIICNDFFQLQHQNFDTLLLLMNGIGLCGSLEGFELFLRKAETLLNKHGKIIFDSCDVSYMFEGIEKPNYYYFGEVQCRYEYQKEVTDWFTWLYLDKDKMKEIAERSGWNSEIIFEDDNQQYLAILTKV